MKKGIAIVFLLLAGLASAGQERPKVAVVLSGGGAKGVAHIEALKAVEEAGIPVDMVCGTSIGALVGALYCVGYSTDFLDSLVRHQDWTALLSDRTDPSTLTLQQRQEQNTYAIIRGLSGERADQGGLIRGRNLAELFDRLCAGWTDSISFDSLPIRFACVATDIVTGEEVDFRSGYLTQAMRASMAIPGVFTPVRMGGHILVDGGMSNNYPADLARRMGADVIIGVTVQNESLKADDIKGTVDVFGQLIDLATKGKYDENIAMSNVLMRVDVGGYSAASFTPAAIDTLIRRGAEEAARHKGELLALKHLIDYAPAEFDPAKRTTRVGQKEDTDVAVPAATRTAIPIVSVGFRFDSEEMGAVTVNYKTPLPTRLPMGLSGTLRLGRHMLGAARLTMFPRGFTSPSVGYDFHLQELDIYRQGNRAYNVKYRRHVVDLSPLFFRLHNVTIRAGLRWDAHDYFGNVLSSDALLDSIADEHLLTYHFSADANSEDHWYFPTRGTRLHFAYRYHTDDLTRYAGHIGITEAMFHLRANATIAHRLTIQPTLALRAVVADSVPYSLLGAVGGEWMGHYAEQQVAFPGMRSIEYTGNYLASAGLQIHYRILNNHYIVVKGAVAFSNDDPLQIVKGKPLIGSAIGYSYNTPLGPADIRVGYNNSSKSPFIYINLGHCF